MNEHRTKEKWHTDDQFESAEIKSHVQTIAEYKSFIKSNVEKYLHASRSPVCTLLDAGCGDGVILKEFVNHKKLELYGIDSNPIRIERCRKLGPEIKLFSQDLFHIDFPDNSFHIVILNHVLEHIKEDVLLLKNIHRILKENGLLILGTPNEGCLLAILRNRLLQSWILKSTDHVQFYTKKTILNKLNAAGYSVIDHRTISFFVPHTKISEIVAGSLFGYKTLNMLRLIFPSQAGSLYFACVKSRQVL